MNFIFEFSLKGAILWLCIYVGFCATFPSSTSIVNTTPVPPVPLYRFHYVVKDEKTGDYKAQEEQRTGDSVTGSYMVAEPNGDLRVVNYVADVANGFKADVNVQQGGSPVKTQSGNPLSAVNQPPLPPPLRDGIAPFNNYRTGISAPPRNRKPARGYNPIIVNNQPFVAVTVPVIKETVGNIGRSRNGSMIPIAKKSVQVDMTFNDQESLDKIEKKSESGMTMTTAKGMNNADIPSTVIEIMNQNKAKFASEKLMAFDTTMVTDRNETLKIIDSIQNVSESTPATTTSPFKKIVVPQRPMRLIGLSPIYSYMEMPQLQSVPDNLTTIPHLHLEPFNNIQYATPPAPFFPGPLPGGPIGSFRNHPQSVPETANIPADYPFVNSIPIFSSIPISAPFIAPTSLPNNDIKTDVKTDIKIPSSQFTLCQDCIVPTGFAGTLPLMKMPAPAPMPVPTNTGAQPLQKMQCPPNNDAPVQWGSYTPNLMYVLMPMPLLKSKINETRSATLSSWKK